MLQCRRILIVEDDQILALQYRYMLDPMGYEILGPLMTGEEAVEQVDALRPDLILMDILLAGKIDGIEAVRQIHQKHEVPVVYLSGISDDEQIRDAQDLGAYGYLLKPVSDKDLHIAIEMALYKHQAELRVRQSEKRYRMLFEKMNNGFGLGEVICDTAGTPVDLRILAINPAFERMIRIRARRLVGKTIKEAMPTYDSGILLDRLGRVALTGQPDQFGYYLQPGERCLDISAFSPEAGQFAIIIEDVTEQRQAEKFLQESELRFRQLAESVREVFWLVDAPSQKILYVSPSYEQVYRRPCAEFYQNPFDFLNVVHPEDAPGLERACFALMETGMPLNEEYRVLHPGGEQRWVWARAYPVKDASGQVVLISGVAEDITERKLAEQMIRDGYLRLEQSLGRMTILRSIDTAITTHNELPVVAAAILSYMTDLEEIDGAILYTPTPSGARMLPTLAAEPQMHLQMVGQSGLILGALAAQAQSWEQQTAAGVFRRAQAEYIEDLCADGQPGAALFSEQTGFRACAALPLMSRDEIKGVLHLFRAQPLLAAQNGDWQHFLESLALQMAIAIDNVDMFENLKRSNRELTKAYEETIKGWAQALELRDKETRGHGERVTHQSEKLARALGMSEEDLLHFRRGVLLHDIGKMGVPDKILNKPDDLTSDEWVIMRQHPGYGYEMLSHIEYLRPALDVVYYHHEKWDGSGYPSGLRGEDIPLTARIFAVVDVYDALTTRRPYRPAWPKSDALTFIRQQAGKHFDPAVAEAFLDLFS
jgi:PAS domain S-box-containing protein/putative nucleotidyltransferase with HDIG domain